MTGRLDEALAQLRARLGETVDIDIGRIAPLAAQRFAIASSDSDPIYFDTGAARSADYSALPVPPLMLTSVRDWGPGPRADDLRADGTPLTDLGIPAGDIRVLGGGQRLRFYRDVTVETDITARVRLQGASRHEGKSGPLLVVEILRIFADRDGQRLVECEETRLLR